MQSPTYNYQEPSGSIEVIGLSGPHDTVAPLVQTPPFRILVVEDSQENQYLIAFYLCGDSYRMTFEEDGEAAVERFVGAEFDLVLMDINMPVMDGLAATRAIRNIEACRSGKPVPILALTSDNARRDREMSISAGCNVHIAKPISRMQLLAAIENYRS